MLRKLTFFASVPILFFSFGVAAQPLSVVINEVMFAPVKPEPEWIELLNTTHDTLNIGGWLLTVHSHSSVKIPDSNTRIPPDSMLILTSNDTELAIYRNIPVDRIVRMSVATLSNNGSGISLRDTSGNLIDSMFYDGTWVKSDGISIERIDPYSAGFLPSNWGSCKDTSGSTILLPNSIRERDHDLALANVQTTTSTIVFSIVNAGIDTAEGIDLLVVIGTLPAVPYHSSTSIPSHDTLIVTVPLPDGFYGLFPSEAYLEDSLDELHSNDTIRFSVATPIPSDSLVINEIMFNPIAGQSQWLEVYNLSTSIISLDSGRLLIGESRPSTYSHLIPPLLIPSDSFGIITANDSILNEYPQLEGRSGTASLNLSTLNFGKDSCSVVLHNRDSSTIDSVHYLKGWQQSIIRKTFIGVSLERKDPLGLSSDENNWRACLDTSGATPLAKNSVDTSSIPNVPPPSTLFQSTFSPDPFSPYDGVVNVDTLTVQTGDENQWALRVRIYDGHGRMVRLLADAVSVFRSKEIVFDGKRDNGQTLPPGLYTALIELTSSSPLQTLKQATGVVIAGKRR